MFFSQKQINILNNNVNQLLTLINRLGDLTCGFTKFMRLVVVAGDKVPSEAPKEVRQEVKVDKEEEEVEEELAQPPL